MEPPSHMKASVVLTASIVLGVLALLPGCGACERLSDKICGELGAEDCAIWREAKGDETIVNSRTKTCVNASFGSSYDVYLNGARITVKAMKDAKEKQLQRQKK